MRRPGLIVLVLVGALFAWVPTKGARAQEAGEPIRLVYTAPAGCPDADAFMADVGGRTSRARKAAPLEEARTFVIVLRGTPEAATGRVVLRDREGNDTSREVGAGRCSDVAHALALVVALALDPAALLAQAPNDATSGATVPTSSTPHTPVAPAPTAARADVPLREAEPAPLLEEAPRGSPRTPAGWRIGAGAQGLLAAGVIPGPAFGASVFVEALRESGALAPVLRLSILRTVTDRVEVGAATGRFAWTSVAVDLCAAAKGPLSGTFGACARGEGGALQADGEGIVNSRGATQGWLAAGAGVRASWRLIGGLSLEADAGLVAALLRDHYYFEPDVTLYEVPLLGGRIALGLGSVF